MPPRRRQNSHAPRADTWGPLIGGLHFAGLAGVWLVLLPLAPLYVGAAYAGAALKRRALSRP